MSAGRQLAPSNPDEAWSRSAGTRSRLVQCAIREFAAKGSEGASTRSIAAAAGTVVSAITYHFGGKRGLHVAAADQIAARMSEGVGPALSAEDAVEGDPAAARTAVVRLIGRFLDEITNDETADWPLFLMREQLAPGEVFERIWAGAMGRLARRLAELVRFATGAPARDAAITTMTLLGQAYAVRGSHAALLRLCELDSLDAATLDMIRARVAANVDAILTARGDDGRAPGHPTPKSRRRPFGREPQSLPSNHPERSRCR